MQHLESGLSAATCSIMQLLWLACNIRKAAYVFSTNSDQQHH